MVDASGLAEVMNLGTGKGIKIRELVEVVGEVLDTEIDVNDAAGVPRDRFVMDSGKLRSLIDFNPHFSLEDGIKETADWMRNVAVPANR